MATVRAHTATGKESLNQLAAAHHTTPQAVIAVTKRYQRTIPRALSAYLSAGKFDKPIPKGSTIVYTDR